MKDKKDVFLDITRRILYVFAALLPVWILPLPVSIEFGRELTFMLLIVLAGLSWCLSFLARGQMRLHYSVIHFAVAGFLIVLTVSVLTSALPFRSLLVNGPSAERFIAPLLGALLMLIVAGSMEKYQIERFLLILFGSTTLAGIITAIQLIGEISLYGIIIFGAGNFDANPVGTLNGLSLFYGMILMMEMSIGFVKNSSLSLIYRMRHTFAISIGILLCNLLLISFQTTWLALLASGIILLGFMVEDIRKMKRFGFIFHSPEGENIAALAREEENKTTKRYYLDWRYPAILFFLAILSFFLFSGSDLVAKENLPTEVSPNLRATLTVARQVFATSAKNALFGVGPGTFGAAWDLFKSDEINRTVFWQVQFQQGSSWVSASFVTLGILGGLLLVLILIGSALVSLHTLLVHAYDSVLGRGVFAGLIVVIIASFLYPANFSLILAFFLLLGLLHALLARNPVPGETQTYQSGLPIIPVFLAHIKIWLKKQMQGGIRLSTFQFQTPWSMFLSSLGVVCAVFLGISSFVLAWGHLRSALAYSQGAAAQAKGDMGQSILYYEDAIRLQPAQKEGYYALLGSSVERMRSLIARAAQGENVQQEFNDGFRRAVNYADQARIYLGYDAQIWRAQGALYALIIPFFDRAEEQAYASYDAAIARDPKNPILYTEKGRAQLAFADRLLFSAQSVAPDEQEDLRRRAKEVLESARQTFTQSISLKSDFSLTHFLLAQIALRLGNVDDAIKNTERAYVGSPNDVGIAFQFGLLLYQNNDFNRAKEVFETLLRVNPQYANARYFLGLIYDRKGEKQDAIAQFAEIEKYNPDNKEIKQILANLREGKNALAGIVPPEPPPEKRTEAPVPERNSQSLRPR
ncbi:MAG: hypothetical protein G01um101466_428 [Parcubacteria group bacterium Gr01-1014_66]|nr:MAG: hypothetical protein G01um101466_428 [Parcubacteria group bacterium Gr01-1014_66]